MPFVIFPPITAQQHYATLEEAIQACDIKIDWINKEFEIFELGKGCKVSRHSSDVVGCFPYTNAHDAIKVLEERKLNKTPTKE